MHGFKIAAAAAVLMAAGSFAQAAETTTGTIEAVDMTGRTIMLDDGVTYSLAEAVKADDLKVGARVTVTYDQADGKITVTALAPAN